MTHRAIYSDASSHPSLSSLGFAGFLSLFSLAHCRSGGERSRFRISLKKLKETVESQNIQFSQI